MSNLPRPSSSFTTPNASYNNHPPSVSSTVSSARSFNSVITGLSRECDTLRSELEQLERQERVLVDHVVPPLAHQYQSLTLGLRKAQEEAGIVRRQQFMLQEQEKQLQQWLQADRRDMEEVTKKETWMEHERIQKKKAFIKEMEKKNEQLDHALGQELDFVWYKLLSPETVELLWNKVVAVAAAAEMEQRDGLDENGGDEKDDSSSSKAILEQPVNQFTQAWTQLQQLMETYELMQEERMQLRAFILEQRDENGGGMIVTEQELLEIEQSWEQQEEMLQEDDDDDDHHHRDDSHQGYNHDNNQVDVDRILMPPPPPPAHMQLFYGTQSSQPLSQPDSIMTSVTAGGDGNGDFHHLG